MTPDAPVPPDPPRLGRPPHPCARRHILAVRFTVEEHDALVIAAIREEETVSDLIRRAVVRLLLPSSSASA